MKTPLFLGTVLLIISLIQAIVFLILGTLNACSLSFARNVQYFAGIPLFAIALILLLYSIITTIGIARQRTPEDIYRIAVHEIGHALVANTLFPNSLEIITIKIRINIRLSVFPTITVSGGHVNYSVTTLFPTKAHLLKKMAILYSGFVAEELIFPDGHSTGVSKDISKATEIAKEMILNGMGPFLTTATPIGSQEFVAACEELAKEAKQMAHKILSQKPIDELARKLVGLETVRKTDIKDFFGT
ncbi:MAG: hypothetical protein J6A89_00775 [Clostridia bacterium]|nr:hypothetical protein [Clostridia bacterium]